MDMTTAVTGNSSRYNSNKLSICSLSPHLRTQLMCAPTLVKLKAIEHICAHTRKGQQKYPDVDVNGVPFPNWALGQLFKSQVLDSVSRHLYKFYSGEDIDAESGSHHLVPVLWGLNVLYHQFFNYSHYKQFDDRPWQGFNNTRMMEYCNEQTKVFVLLEHIETANARDITLDVPGILENIFVLFMLIANILYRTTDDNIITFQTND